MTVTYALVSVVCGAVCAVFAWIESGPLLAAITYVCVGSAALLVCALLVSAAPLQGSRLLDPRGVKPRRNSAAG